MARDKAKDDRQFNCSQEHERVYVSGLYGVNALKVKAFLVVNCQGGAIRNSTHAQVYTLIKDKLGFAIPVSI